MAPLSNQFCVEHMSNRDNTQSSHSKYLGKPNCEHYLEHFHFLFREFKQAFTPRYELHNVTLLTNNACAEPLSPPRPKYETWVVHVHLCGGNVKWTKNNLKNFIKFQKNRFLYHLDHFVNATFQ